MDERLKRQLDFALEIDKENNNVNPSKNAFFISYKLNDLKKKQE